MTAANTGNLTAGRYMYDVLIHKTATGEKTRVVEGSALVTAGVTTG